MNILHIIGNGFDKAMGMKTSYPEFYEYLKSLPEKGSPLLELMKKDIGVNKKYWSDMEEALGQFTSKIESGQEFVDFYYELSDRLQEYLAKELASFTRSEKLKGKIISDLLNLDRNLGDIDKIPFRNFTNTVSKPITVYVMSLNYTDTLEKILAYDNKSALGFGNNNTLQPIVHVHGLLNDSIIIGVDNDMQIANKTFRENDDVKDLFVKVQSNLVMKYNRHAECEKFISNADLIVLFGVSMGETDARWWKLIGEQMMKKKTLRIIQFLYSPKVLSSTRRQLMGAIERQQRSDLKKKLNISDKNLSEELDKRIFISVNSRMFVPED